MNKDAQQLAGNFVPLARPFFDALEIKHLQEVLDSGWVSQGPKTKEFENRCAEYLGIKHAIPVVNCTAALHLALLAIDVKPGDEVIVADFTFPATGHAVAYCGAKPVFVDIDPRTYNIDPALIEKKITPRTRAIIPVHTFGQPADMDPIMAIAERYSLKVIEDAACAFGAKYKGRHAGTIGDIGCFSFHARKGLTTGEGGMIVTGESSLADRMRRLSTFGMVSAWQREGTFSIPQFRELGYNYKMSDITAAIGVAQLEKLDKMIAKRRQLASYWDSKLGGIDSVILPHRDDNAFHIFQSYVVLLDKKFDRNRLIKLLLDRGVQTQIGTYASHIQPVYASLEVCQNSLNVFQHSLALPLYCDLTEQNIDFAVAQLHNILRGNEGCK